MNEGFESCEMPSRGRYTQGCRCDACRAANSAYERARNRYGWASSFVDAEPVRRRVEKLLEAGYTERELCRVAGVARTTMSSLMRRHHRTGEPVKRIKAETAARIMAVDGRRRLGSATLVPAARIADMVKGRLADGFTVADVARAAGIPHATLSAVANGRRLVQAKTLYKWQLAEQRVLSMRKKDRRTP